MNLCERWICEERASFVSAIGRCDVTATRVCRQIEYVAISSAGERDGVGCMPLHFSRAQVPSDNSLGLSIDDYQVQHLCVWKHLHRARGDLATKRLVTA